MSAAAALADLGHAVELVEKEPSLGGRVGRLNLAFPHYAAGSAIISPLVEKVAGSGAITTRLS